MFGASSCSADRKNPGAPGSTRRLDRHLVADLAAHQGLADRRVRRHPADTRDLDLHLLALVVFDLHGRPDADRVGLALVLVDDDRSLETVAQHRDPPLEQTLFVLRGVVLEVLRQIAEAARTRDGLHGLGAFRAFELGELRLELLLLRLGEMLGLVLGHRGSLAKRLPQAIAPRAAKAGAETRPPTAIPRRSEALLPRRGRRR